MAKPTTPISAAASTALRYGIRALKRRVESISTTYSSMQTAVAIQAARTTISSRKRACVSSVTSRYARETNLTFATSSGTSMAMDDA